MKKQQSYPADKIIIVLLGIITLLSGCIALLVLLSLFITGTEFIIILPIILGPLIGSLGVILMIHYRKRFNIGTIQLSIASILWFFGVSTLSFTGFAVFDYAEPSEYLSNLGYSLMLCLVPGIILTGMGVLLYGSDARRNLPKNIDYDDYIHDLKDNE